MKILILMMFVFGLFGCSNDNEETKMDGVDKATIEQKDNKSLQTATDQNEIKNSVKSGNKITTIDGYEFLKWKHSLTEVKELFKEKKLCTGELGLRIIHQSDTYTTMVCNPGLIIEDDYKISVFNFNTSDNKLDIVMVLLGSYSEDLFRLSSEKIGKEYQLNKGFSSEDLKKFEAKTLNYISSKYANDAIKLQLSRDPKSNQITIALIYRSKRAVALEKKKAKLKDDLAIKEKEARIQKKKEELANKVTTVDGYKFLKWENTKEDTTKLLYKNNLCRDSNGIGLIMVNLTESHTTMMCDPGLIIGDNHKTSLFVFNNSDKKLDKIIIVLGPYSKDTFGFYFEKIGKKYRLNKVFSSEDLKKFDARLLNNISNKYANDAVQLQIERNAKNNQNNILLVYQSKRAVALAKKKSEPKDDF
jgi:hypothetical protein